MHTVQTSVHYTISTADTGVLIHQFILNFQLYQVPFHNSFQLGKYPLYNESLPCKLVCF